MLNSIRHKVNKWIKPGEVLANGFVVTNGFFKEVWSESTSYYSLAAYLDGDEDQDEIEVDTLWELYKMWQEEKAGDEAVGERGRWKYHFYKHDEVVEDGHIIDYVTEIKVYKRGNKIFARGI